MAYYLDEARSINARGVMARALKSGMHDSYDVPFEFPDPACRRSGTGVLASLKIDLRWPGGRSDMVCGTVLFRYPREDGQLVEQILAVQGVPARVGGWQWHFICPDTHHPARTLYLAPHGKHFQSRDAAGLKIRRLSRVARRQRDYYQILDKLQIAQWQPVIARPAGMTEQIYDKLCNKLEQAYTRLLCAVLKRPEPEFCDSKPKQMKPGYLTEWKAADDRSELPPGAWVKRPPRFAVRNRARERYVRDSLGTLKLRHKPKKQSAVPQNEPVRCSGTPSVQ